MGRLLHHLLDRPKAERRAGEDIIDPADDSIVEFFARRHFIHQAQSQRFGRAEAVAGEEEAHGAFFRDQPRQAHHAALQRKTADAGLRQAELCFLGGDHDVAAEHHLEPAAERVAVHSGDHGNVECGAQRDATKAAGARFRPVAKAIRAAVLHVGADGKGAVAGAGQDDAADIAVRLELAPDVLKSTLRLGVDSVHAIGAIDGHPGNMVLDREIDAHASASSLMPISARISSVCAPSVGG